MMRLIYRCDTTPAKLSDILLQVRVLFVRNLSPSTDEEELRRMFNAMCGGRFEKVKKIRDYASVHFCSREAAELAFRLSLLTLNLSPAEIDGSVLAYGD